MIRICARCGKFMGEKEPFEDRSVTTGLCQSCLEAELERLERERDREVPEDEEDPDRELWKLSGEGGEENSSRQNESRVGASLRG